MANVKIDEQAIDVMADDAATLAEFIHNTIVSSGIARGQKGVGLPIALMLVLIATIEDRVTSEMTEPEKIMALYEIAKTHFGSEKLN